MKNIVIFASGSGTNAENIIHYFEKRGGAKVVAVFCNNPHAKVIEKSKKKQVPCVVFSKENLKNTDFIKKIIEYKPDLIVLAGFLLQFPESIVKTFTNKIINIHPALLPKYGGKGMYGLHVHRSIFENKELETGITIHYVTEQYDDGKIIFQKKVSIQECQNLEEIAVKVQQLEQIYLPEVIHQLLTNTQ